MENLILIGMPSSGKSTAGVLLAKKIGFGFLDCDMLIQGKERKLLPEIIHEKGMEGFLNIEESVCASIYAERCVISTGGSAVYSQRAMEHLKTIGKIVYLKISLEEAQRRISPDLGKRGVVMRGNVKSLRELFLERTPLYEKYAQITVDGTGKNIDQTVEDIALAAGFSL